MRLPRPVVGVFFVGLAVACGGATPTLGAGADGGGGGPGGACPGSAPVAESACTGSFECEYGDDPDVSCDTVATCNSGRWLVRPATQGCAISAGAGCPATYAALLQQSLCTPENLECAFAEARCTCATHCGMVGRPEATWCCPDAPQSGNGCPSPRPRIGSTCSTSGTVCDYGGCDGNVTLQCSGGSWQPTQVGCPG
ncbi:MAG TPA: hypothetical protein VGG39_24505 [Polyangiaceae bacterium]|jgi:hypothetical protein